MPKKAKTYKAVVLLDSESLKRFVQPGEIIELPEDAAKILLDIGAIEEAENGSNVELPELGKLQDRTK